jgi:N-ATPase, AtpR subunit
MTMSAVASAATAATAIGAGLTFGLAYFVVLRRTVDLCAAAHGRLVPAVLTLGRLLAAILLLGVAARMGALPLLASFGGFLLARALAMCAARR